MNICTINAGHAFDRGLPLASPVLLIPNTINGLGACQRHNACGKIHSVTVGALYYVLRCGCTASTFAALCKVRLSQTDMSAVRHPALVNTKTSKSKARGAPNASHSATTPLLKRAHAYPNLLASSVKGNNTHNRAGPVRLHQKSHTFWAKHLLIVMLDKASTHRSHRREHSEHNNPPIFACSGLVDLRPTFFVYTASGRRGLLEP